MRLLYDARLPRSLALEADDNLKLERWTRGSVTDVELVHAAAADEYDGVILLDRDSLAQIDVQSAAREARVALIAVEADGPLEAKLRVQNNASRLRRALSAHDCLLVLANEVRPIPVDAQDVGSG